MSKKNTILHCVEAFEGGVLQSMANICNGLARYYNFVVLHGWRPNTDKVYAGYFPANTKFIAWNVGQSLSPISNCRSVLELRKVVRETNPLRIHAHSSTAGALTRLAFPISHNFIVYSPRCFAFLRQDISSQSRTFFYFIEWILARLAHTIAACGFDEFAHARLICKKSVCIPNSVIFEDIDRRVLGVRKPSQITVVDSGRITPQKNFSMFARIAEAFLDYDYKFIWVGDGNIKAALKGQEMPGNLCVTGWLTHEESLQTLASAHIFLHTALWEGLSRTCLEAASLRLPLLLYPSDGAKELIPEQGQSGFLCKNVEEFVLRLKLITADKKLLNSLGNEARYLIEQHYNALNINDLWRKLYTHGKI